MVYLGFKPRAAEWKAQMNPLSYVCTLIEISLHYRPQIFCLSVQTVPGKGFLFISVKTNCFCKWAILLFYFRLSYLKVN